MSERCVDCIYNGACGGSHCGGNYYQSDVRDNYCENCKHFYGEHCQLRDYDVKSLDVACDDYEEGGVE